MIVENKVDTKQHSGQLARYYQLELKNHPKRAIFGIYLTVDGDEPENENYAPMSHSTVRTLLTAASTSPGLHIEPGVQFAIKQYTEVLERHFMADEQIKKLCEKIYKEHKQAIDLLISYRPNPGALIRERLKELIQANSTLILDDCTKTFVRFIPRALDLSYFKRGSGYTSSRRLFLFEFKIDKAVVLFIQMGGGDSAVRKQVHELALAKKKVFRTEAKLSPQWQLLFKKPIAEGLDGEVDQDDLIQKIESKWQEFLEIDLPIIEQTFLTYQLISGPKHRNYAERLCLG